jgi:hypothetical protein
MKQAVTDFLLFAIIFVLIAVIVKQCKSAKDNDSKANSYHSETHDTVYMPGQPVFRDRIIYKPYPVYTSAASPAQKIVNACDSVRAYFDSLRIDSTSIVYYKDTVLGKKLTHRLTFYGKPYTKIITNTIRDSIVIKSNKGGFYFNCDMGASLREYPFVKSSSNTRLAFGLGADYVTKKKLQIGYRYGVFENSHSLKIGFKLF